MKTEIDIARCFVGDHKELLKEDYEVIRERRKNLWSSWMNGDAGGDTSG